MKIIYLNCQHGSLRVNLFKFIQKHILTTDIFCLQEVPTELQELLVELLPNYVTIYDNLPINSPIISNYGQSIFISDKLNVVNSKTIEPYINRSPNYGFLQFADVEIKNKIIRVLNLHGRSQPGHKNDTKTRIKQSETIVSYLFEDKHPNILGGDFNLNPETKSIKIIEDEGLINLISKYGIKTTRNSMAWSQAVEHNSLGLYKYYGKQPFADYCFVSKDVTVKNFEVPDIEISDHLPLILDFDI